MAATAASSFQITASKPCIFSAKNILKGNVANIGIKSLAKLSSACHASSAQHFFTTSPAGFDKAVTKATSETGESKPASGLSINLKGNLPDQMKVLRQPRRTSPCITNLFNGRPEGWLEGH